ncbi:MAG: hypothetical protein AB8G11_07840 [Saprospiraceae bacterium]
MMFISEREIELLKSKHPTLTGNPKDPMSFSILTQSMGGFNSKTNTYEFILLKQSLN